MTTSRAEPVSTSAERGRATAAGISCYLSWGLIPVLFQLVGRLGAGPWEILAHRILWGAPTAVVLVLLARQGHAARAVLRQPRTLGWLALSAATIAANWIVFIWAVNSGRVLETSLGYYILPLLNIAAGALMFGERIDRVGRIAIAFAAAGVALQTLALGHLPVVSLALAISFGAYGIIRKRVTAEAQTGFLFESAFLVLPSAVFVLWLGAHGASGFGRDLPLSLWLVACGPLTAIPLLWFAWAARRLPLSAMGFLQFIAPTLTFGLGLLQGEIFTPLRGASFALIWAGVAIFAYGVWRKSRAALAATEAVEAAAQ
ncbi:EamA family transporter RarD [Phenylobacterium sp. LjRoot219]|uniref:EamA family transporter RarD n=1 Tax=Phenylobacterium sp. LjRoot219 TaxID=3342283 RepID=UPI003ECFEF2D